MPSQLIVIGVARGGLRGPGCRRVLAPDARERGLYLLLKAGNQRAVGVNKRLLGLDLKDFHSITPWITASISSAIS